MPLRSAWPEPPQEPALAALPIDDEGLEVDAPVAQLEVVYASINDDRHGDPMTIDDIAATQGIREDTRYARVSEGARRHPASEALQISANSDAGPGRNVGSEIGVTSRSGARFSQ